MFEHWKLPEAVCRAIRCSHAPQDSDPVTGLGARCLALGGECVELLTACQQPEQIPALGVRAQELLGIDPELLAGALQELLAEIPEIERLFDVPLLSTDACAGVLEQARELLTIRNLRAYQQVVSLREAAQTLQARTAALEDQRRRDALTGVFNRGHLDDILEREFRASSAEDWPLSVIFVDLDRFKQINDNHGHAAGDLVLASTARLLQSVVRDSDFVARYGGEEFVIVLPGLPTDGAAVLGERLLKRLRAVAHAVGDASLTVTASLGLATHRSTAPFASVTELLAAADRCVYAAKRAGRDRLVINGEPSWAQTG